MTAEEITDDINSYAIKIHNTLGTGFQGLIHQKCLEHKPIKSGLFLSSESERK